MSLRTKLLAATSVIVFIAVLLVAGGSILTTTRELENEVDRTLDARVEQVAASLRNRRGIDFLGRRVRSPLDEALLATQFDTVTQVIDPNGNVLINVGAIDLPVTAGALRVAWQSADGPQRESLRVDGVPYRMLAVGLVNGGALQLAKDVSDIEAARFSILRWLIVLAAFAISGAAASSWWVARQTTRPIRQLASSADEIARSGVVGSPLTVEADREIAQLAMAFNKMLEALKESAASQNRLVQDASHELRTPLTSLRANAELLQRENLDARTRRDLLANLTAEIDALTELSTELSRLAINQRDIEQVEHVNMFPVLSDVAARASRRSGRAIVVTGDQNAARHLRPEQFERAVGNLINNAVKFSPAETEITVIVTNESIQVVDRGPGVDDADKPHIFDRFYRSTRTRGQPGSGLGLAIVKQFADDHEAITFVRDGPDGGAIIGISFRNQSTY